MTFGCTTIPSTEHAKEPGSDPLALMEIVADWQLARSILSNAIRCGEEDGYGEGELRPAVARTGVTH